MGSFYILLKFFNFKFFELNQNNNKSHKNYAQRTLLPKFSNNK
jgi:hypothetical protein